MLAMHSIAGSRLHRACKLPQRGRRNAQTYQVLAVVIAARTDQVPSVHSSSTRVWNCSSVRSLLMLM
jgi:hypothetical protein